MMLDADNLPLRDPAHLFGSPQALQHGAMFWLDLWSPFLSSTTFIGHNSVYSLLGINKEQYWVRTAIRRSQTYLCRQQGWGFCSHCAVWLQASRTCLAGFL